MIPSSPARPRISAPSTATLRVLYQLAYISSGTALGVGALCAEERRRRTKIVQRIADNAKRIRQSPRYSRGSHSVAAVSEVVDEGVYPWGGAEDSRSTSAYAGPHLPSIVEREYGEVAERKGKARWKSMRPPIDDPTGRNEGELMGADDAGTHSRRRLPARESKRPVFARMDSLSRESEHISGSSHRSRHEGRDNFVTGDPRTDVPRAASEDTNTRAKESDSALCDGPISSGTMAKHPLKHTSSTSAAEGAISSPNEFRIKMDDWVHEEDHPAHDTDRPCLSEVDTFLESARDLDTLTEEVTHMSDRLLAQSLENGTAADIRSLVLWKIRHNLLTLADIRSTMRSIGKATRHSTDDNFISFIDSLRSTPAYTEATGTQQLDFDLALRAEICKLSRQYDYPETQHVRSAILKTLQCWSSGVDVPQVLHQHCQGLIAENHCEAALELFRQVCKGTSHSQRVDFEKVADSMYATLLTRQHLSLCAALLNLKLASGPFSSQVKQYDALVALCSQVGATGMLKDLLDSTDAGTQLLASSQDLDYLSTSSRVLVARTLGGDATRVQSFRTMYRLIPREMRSLVTQHHVDASIAALKNEWRSTLNLVSVRELHATLHANLLPARHDRSARALNFALVDIYLSAGKRDLALQLLENLNATPKQGPVGVLLMLAAAKSRDWTAFHIAMDALIQDPSLVTWNVMSTRVFNEILHRYAACHSADTTSTLASRAMKELSFAPNVATFNTLLSACVRHQNIALTGHWLTLRKTYTASHRVSISSLAVTLLRIWYHDFRHSHVMVMWYCRTLLEEARSIRGEQLMDVVLEAIGSDLRNLAGSNAPWMNAVILERLALVRNSRDHVPKPGKTHGKTIVLPSVRRTNLAEAEPNSSHQLALVHNLLPTPAGERAEFRTKTHTAAFDLPAAATGSESKSSIKELEDLNDAPIDWSAHPMEAIQAPDLDAPQQTVFSDLRHEYGVKPKPASDRGDVQNSQTQQRLHPERAMMLAFSLSEYAKVIDIYESSRDAVGLPISPLALEQAVESSIRLHNDIAHAESLLASARAAGMNTSLCTGPILMYKLRHISHLSISEAQHIRFTTLAYYAENDARGYGISGHLGTQAAYALLTAGHAGFALNLLSSIYHPDVLHRRAPDIGAMSVWLLAYAALHHVSGMQWVVNTILERNITIDMAFLRCLKRAKRPTHPLPNGGKGFGRQDLAVQTRIETWRGLCRERRARQMWESKVFGRKLVRLLVRDANEAAGIKKVRVKRWRRPKVRRIEPRQRPHKMKRMAIAKHRRARAGSSRGPVAEGTVVNV